ncbi:MAG: Protein GrpE [Parcubacteria group bacterium GW2011_GWA2_43_17]|nr:MAG: Protein GrpE [Parcubacteria group bacterium GW2011_GWA2_43_17]KKT91004.1 MAG: Protein GrpE [Parcubacteria group bacterium GW2011_GWF2_45_11]KKT97538.1 MAG: Protein GrpE [Parcubacteria group bacterium GW2011_GWC2_45_15]OGY93174.1 MAG: nucleotide exchange factor GrpE [Candidatus Komeilibacteria bacterium RIFOXYA2_FULL_45_9]OGY96297.1 MAG: nucleotide exchange factor GrpE [Candidatus Komeilibacteria bacterium RIFOXYC2_FULL_45_12]HAH04178.1 nucleotide exchange factor GrpE [Candidatus Komeil
MSKDKKSADQAKDRELEAKCQEYLQGWQRAQADYQNLQKETAARAGELREYIQANLLLEVLPIYDHYQLALKHIPAELAEADWVKGFVHIKKNFSEFFKQFALEEIKSEGEEFDPQVHEAVGQAESDQPENRVIKEVSAGYKINGQVIRPAKVILAKSTKADEDSPEKSAAGQTVADEAR